MKDRTFYTRLLYSLISIFLLSLSMVACGTDSGSSKLFNSGAIAPGKSFSYTFENEGTIEYYCDIHAPDMQGKVTISSGAEISDQDTVEMENTQFNPAQVTVAPGTKIVWINRDSFEHTVVEGNPSTDSGSGYY